MPDDAVITAPNPYAALGIPNFRRYIVGLLAFTMAIQIQGTVVGWQIYELTHDKLALGLIGLAEAIPFIGMSLYAGHVADKHDRRRIALTALVVLTACSAALLLLPLFLSRAPQTVTRAIYAVIVTSGFARAFLQPARQALGEKRAAEFEQASDLFYVWSSRAVERFGLSDQAAALAWQAKRDAMAAADAIRRMVGRAKWDYPIVQFSGTLFNWD